MDCTIRRAHPLNLTANATRYGSFAIHVVMPIAIGAMIYVLFRTTSLLVFDWLETARLLQLSLHLRQICSEIHLPDWLLYSLPDGLWVYGLTSWMILIWDRKPPLPWLLVGVALGLGGELGQLMGIVPGTYQNLDMIFYTAGFLAACLQLEMPNETSLPIRIGPASHGHFRFWKR